MNFLFSSFLPALAAAALPVIIHLLSRRRLPTIPFSAVRFLQRLQANRARRVQFKQILLLILRTIAVAALVLLFARPALKGGAAAGAGAATEMVVVLDDALTSAAEDRDGQLFRRSLSALQKLAQTLGPSDQMTIISATHPEQSFTFTAGQRESFGERVAALNPNPWLPDTAGIQAKVDSIFSRSDRFNRELFFVGAFHRGVWDYSHLPLGSGNHRRIVLPVGTTQMENLTVERLEMRSALLQRGRPFEMTANFRNEGKKAASGIPVAVYLEGERVAQATVDVPPGATVGKDFIFTPSGVGRIAGQVQIEEPDALTMDNRRNFILRVPEHLSVMAVSPDQATQRILNAALGQAAGEFLKMTWVQPQRWEAENFAGFDCVLLAGLERISSGAAERLSAYVEKGGGVIFFQGHQSDLANLSRGAWSSLGFGGAGGFTASSSIGWAKLDLQHPLFRGVFEQGGAPRSPTFSATANLFEAKGDQVIIRLADGRPFLIERQLGDGRALLFAAALSPEAGDFIVSGVFLPLLIRSIAYASDGSGENAEEWTTGTAARITLPISNAAPGRLTPPNGDLIELPPKSVAGGMEFHLRRVTQAGVYSLEIGGQPSGKFAANIPAGAGKLERGDYSELARAFNAQTLNPESERLAGELHAMRFGRELWRPLAILVLLLLAAESLLGRGVEKGGTAEAAPPEAVKGSI